MHVLHEHARVIRSEYRGETCVVEAEAPESILRRLSAYLDGNEHPAG